MNKKLLLLFTCIIVLASCSLNKMVINKVSDALTGPGGSDVFTGDSDPALVGDSLPFAIKLYETLLAQNPDHQGLILTTGSLFVMYANAFVQGPAEMLPISSYREKTSELERAKKLYLRGADILYSGLEKKYPGFGGSFRAGKLDSFLAKTKKDDVPLLYWAVAGILSAYSLDAFNMELGVRVPELKTMIERAYVLDPDFNKGAIDDFFIIFYSALPENLLGDHSDNANYKTNLVDDHFKKAVEKSGGFSASPYISYAKSVCIPAQDYETFKEKLEIALKINPNDDPSNRLVNVLSIQKAKYLLENAGMFFLELDSGGWEDWGEWEDWEYEF